MKRSIGNIKHILRFFASLRMTEELVSGKRITDELFVVILRSLPQADDEESQRDVKRKACSGHERIGRR